MRIQLFNACSVLLALWQLIATAQAAKTNGLQGPDFAGSIWGPDAGCRRRLRRLQGGQGIETVSPPDLHGDWVSSRCETRPGPSFLTRRYKFHSDLSFTFYQFYYADHQCQTPAYSYRIRGQLTMGSLSWMLTGANEALYDVEKVILTVFRDDFAAEFARQLNESCSDLVVADKPLELVRKYVIVDNSREDTDAQVDCARSLAFTMHELQVLRQEVQVERELEGVGAVRRRERLFLGDIHTDITQRTSHKPGAYQTPLRKYDDDSQANCPVCRIVYNAREHRPPVLPHRQRRDVILRGSWVSIACEVRSVYFLTRHLVFFNNETWEGHYHYYRDPLCQFPMYTVSVKGSRTAGTPSHTVEGATDFRFTSRAMLLTAQSEDEVARFNSKKGDGCGRRGAWKIGKTIDVTTTGGCDVIGLQLPHTEYEVMKMEDDPEDGLLLYNGQRPSDGRQPTSESLRPTSFQSALAHCSEDSPREILYTEGVKKINARGKASRSLPRIYFVLLMNIVVLAVSSSVRWHTS